jgi:M6 family metalloprotease-like protein
VRASFRLALCISVSSLLLFLCGRPQAAQSGSRLLNVTPLRESQARKDVASKSSLNPRGHIESAYEPSQNVVREILRRRAFRDCFGTPGLSARKGSRFYGGLRAPAPQAPMTLRVLGLRVDFLADRMGSLTTTVDGKFDLRRGTTQFIDPPPHNRDYFMAHLEALSRYYSAMSFGQLQVEYDVFPQNPDSAFHLSDTADYGPWTYSQEDYQLGVRLITDAVSAADNSSEPINFSQYDIVIIFHSGADLQGDINNDSPWDLPSFSAELGDPIPVDNGTSYVYGASVIPETSAQDGLLGAINGVVTHEFGHMIGLPDLYNTDDFMPAIGYWSLMDTGNYLGGLVQDPNTGEVVYVFGLLPGGLDPWCRRELGRIFGIQTVQQVEVGAQWSDTLRAIELTSRLLDVPASATEYFMIENRESDLDGNGLVEVRADSATGVILGPESNEYDALLPGSGILVWHIDESVITRRRSLGLSPNGGLSDRGIDLEEADGIEDLGNPSSAYWLGSEFDPYFVGNATQFNPTTVPNSDANSGAISQVFASIGSQRQVGMHVSVERRWAREGWPVVAGPLEEASPGFGDFDRDGVKEVFLASPDSTVRAWKADGSAYRFGEPKGRFADAAGPILPTLCFSEGISALVGTVVRGDADSLYAWAVNDLHSPVTPGQVLAGWPPVIPSITTSPCAVAEDIIAGCSDGKVYAIDSAGTPRWGSHTSLGFPIKGSIAAGDMDRDGYYEVAFSGGGAVGVVSSIDGEFLFPPYELPDGSAADSMGPYVIMADVDGKPDSTLEVLVTTGSGSLFAFNSRGELLEGWPVFLNDPVSAWPAAGDVDGDGQVEIVVHSSSGKLYVVNGTGVVSSGWPIPTGSSGNQTRNAPSVCDLNSDNSSEIVFASEGSQVSAVLGDAEPLRDWPVAVGSLVRGSPALSDLEEDGKPELFQAAGDSLLVCLELPYSVSHLEWPLKGNSSARTNCLERRGGLPPQPGQALIVRGEVYSQPNPSRGPTTSIRYALSAPARVRLEIFDLSGRKVYSNERQSPATENSFVWSHKGFPPGVYIIRVEAEGLGRKDVAFTKASVLY